MNKVFRNNRSVVGIYVRVSTAGQTKGNGLRNQFIKCKGLIRRKGFRDYQLFQDDGYSGETLDRPDIKKLMDAVHTGEIKLVAVYAFDRLTRSENDVPMLLDKFARYGVRLVTHQEGLDTDLSEKEQLSATLGYAVTFDSKHRKERTVAGKRERAKNFVYAGGSVLFGYRQSGRTLSIEKSEAEIIELIFQMEANDFKPSEIADELKIKKKLRPDGVELDARAIREILGRKQRYRGYFVNKIMVKGREEKYVHFDRNLAILRDSGWKKLCRKYFNFTHTPDEKCNGRCMGLRVGDS